MRRLPSPLQESVNKVIAKRQKQWAQEGEASESRLSEIVGDVAKINESQQVTKQRDSLRDLDESRLSASELAEVASVDELEVDEWEFTSDYAIAHEYVTSSNMVVV